MVACASCACARRSTRGGRRESTRSLGGVVALGNRRVDDELARGRRRLPRDRGGALHRSELAVVRTLATVERAHADNGGPRMTRTERQAQQLAARLRHQRTRGIQRATWRAAGRCVDCGRPRARRKGRTGWRLSRCERCIARHARSSTYHAKVRLRRRLCISCTATRPRGDRRHECLGCRAKRSLRGRIYRRLTPRRNDRAWRTAA